MNEYEKAVNVLPLELRVQLNGIPSEVKEQVQEIRLRRGQPVCLSVRGKRRYLSQTGGLCGDECVSVICREEWLDKTFDKACEHSVYAHQEELKNGYVTTCDGCRIGIAGTAVIRSGEITSFHSITSLCLRVAREHRGCAEEVANILCKGMSIHSALICGEPSSGKSSLLKDLIRQLSSRGLSVAVIDERGELSPNGTTHQADVLLHVPKAEGFELAVRTLSPQVIVFDELGNDREIGAVTEGIYRGVCAVSSVHCHTREDLIKRTPLLRALHNNAFEYLFFLEGRQRPGNIRQWVKTEEWLREMVGNDPAVVCGDRVGSGSMAETATTCHRPAKLFGTYQSPLGTNTLYNSAHGDPVERVVFR